ncbi:MAG: hypothetical protein U0414_25340 [Polyangiaceae bacterium]
MSRVHRSVLCAGAALLSACEFCPAITCDDEVHVTLSNVAGLFESTTEPSVEVCSTEGCGWFHFTNEKGDITCTPDDMSLESRTGCAVAGGVAQLASFGGPDGGISTCRSRSAGRTRDPLPGQEDDGDHGRFHLREGLHERVRRVRDPLKTPPSRQGRGAPRRHAPRTPALSPSAFFTMGVRSSSLNTARATAARPSS